MSLTASYLPNRGLQTRPSSPDWAGDRRQRGSRLAVMRIHVVRNRDATAYFFTDPDAFLRYDKSRFTVLGVIG